MAYWIWRMLHDVRVPPVESALHKGDIISPNHPYFPWLHDDYRSSRTPLMERVLMRDGPTLVPGEPSARSVEGQHPCQDDDRAQWIAKILDPAIKPLFDPGDTQEPGMSDATPVLETSPTLEAALSFVYSPARRRKRPKKYSNRDNFVALLKDVIQNLRIELRNREPTLGEIAYASDKITGVTLWPEGMSPVTLRSRLRDHKIILDDLLEDLPWPCRGLP